MGVLDDLPPPSSALDDLPPPATWSDTAKGIGQTGLALGSGALKAIYSAANDILPEAIGGSGSRAAMQQRIEQDPTFNYRGGPEAQPIMSTLADLTKPIAKIGGAIHQGISDLTSPRTADVLGDIATLAPGARGAFSKLEPGTAIQEAHPLSAAAQAEENRMQGHIAKAKSQGLELAPREVSPAQTYVDNAARRDLNLPGNSPVTSGVLDAADKLNVSPHFSAAQKFDPQLVATSQQGRSVARGLYDDAGNMNLTFAQRSAARAEAQQNYQAAKAAEAQFRAKATAAGQQELADNWDAARIYKAKLETWRDALQGGVEGHVNGLKIRKLGLADEPLSGAQAEAASVAAQHPDQFGSGIAVKRPGPIGRFIKKAAPVAGAAAGGAVAPGVIGPMVGAELAGSLADRVIR